MNLKIIFVGNNTLIGRFDEETKILDKPRSIAFGQDPKGRPIIGFQELVGGPKEVKILKGASLMYDTEDQMLIELYVKATTGIEIAKDLSNVRPIRPGSN